MSDFKPDDKVICIDNTDRSKDLELYKIYTVVPTTVRNRIALNEFDETYAFKPTRFITADLSPLEKVIYNIPIL